MKQLITFFFTLLLSTTLMGQAYFTYKDYALEKEVDTGVKELNTSDFNYVILKQKNVKEYIFEDEQFIKYDLIHRRIKILTEKGIEMNNKIFIPLYGDKDLYKYEARVIDSDGKVKNLSKDVLEKAVNPETDVETAYFAFEGISVGSVIEYFYIKRSPVRSTSTAMFMQADVPKFDVSFEIISPNHLVFKTLSKNGLEEFQVDTNVTEKTKLFISIPYIEAFISQENAFDRPNMQYFLAKLDENRANGSYNIGSYASLSENVYKTLYNIEKSDQKVIKKILKNIELSGKDEEAKIREIENYIKTNYVIIENSAAELSDLGAIYDNKAMNKSGALELFVAIFSYLDIKHEVVLTADRTEVPFEEEFEAYLFLDKSLLYFPTIKKIMDPDSPMFRLGWTGSAYMNTHGLFIKAVEIGDYSVGVGKIKFIEPLPSKVNYHSLEVSVDFTDGFDNVSYDIKNEANGFKAYTQAIYDFVKDEEKLDEINKSTITYIDSEGDIKDLKVTNTGGNNYGTKPLITEATIESGKFIEFAGDNILFKLGELIGPQMELYQEEERTLPVQLMFNRRYERKITFTIPEGYKISNLDDIKITEEHKDESGEVIMAFYSDYEKKDNKVIVTSTEYYKELDLPAEQFKEYQRVINAAANFNKILLVLEE